jgi:mono/diheme cytochrome c family protein
MRLCSRELIVGFSLVLVLVAVGCQPVQPNSESSAVATTEPAIESEVMEGEAVTGTATLVETTPVTESVTNTTNAESPTTDSATVTATIDITESAETTTTESVAPTEPAASADPALLAAGLAVYRAQYCGVCHTLDAAETRGTFGPSHNGMGAIAAAHLAEGSYQGVATTPAEYIRESIVDPLAYIVPGYATTSHRMPSYAHLDNASLDALVAFLLAQ